MEFTMDAQKLHKWDQYDFEDLDDFIEYLLWSDKIPFESFIITGHVIDTYQEGPPPFAMMLNHTVTFTNIENGETAVLFFNSDI